MIYERQDQISFLDGHVRAFAHFDAVPARIAYDYVARQEALMFHVVREIALRVIPSADAHAGRRLRATSVSSQ